MRLPVSYRPYGRASSSTFSRADFRSLCDAPVFPLFDQERQSLLFQELAALRMETAKALEVRDSDRWLDAKAAAEYMGMSRSTFDKYRYKTTPKLDGYPIDGKVLYKKREIDRFIRLYSLKASGLA